MLPLAQGLVGILVLLSLIVVKQFRHSTSSRKLPPGPPADPIIGHVRVLPLAFQWETFTRWAKEYGDIVYVHAFGKPIVILNSYSVGRDILDRKGANFSDRPRLVMLSEMMGWGNLLAFERYGERFRRLRRLAQLPFAPQAVGAYIPVQQREVRLFVQSLLSHPDDFAHHIHRMLARTVVMVTYGQEVKHADDPIVQLNELVTDYAVASGPVGGTPPDLIPLLRYTPAWLPGAGFKRLAIKSYKTVKEMIDFPYEMVRRDMIAGVAKRSVVSDLLEKYGDSEAQNDIKSLGGVMYLAAVETSQVFIETFFNVMARFPNFAKRAQEEIDAEVGPDRLPTLDDRKTLPYIDCIIREVFRWNPPIALGLPHASMSEDTYRGMTIPARSMVLANIWNMMRDESYYTEPYVFNPDRFLSFGVSDEKYQWGSSESGQAGEENDRERLAASDPLNIVFGFGRRICPGRFFAYNGLWLTVATVLAVFDISPEVDPLTGEVQSPLYEHMPGATSRLKPFRCRIIPRFEKVALTVTREVNAEN